MAVAALPPQIPAQAAPMFVATIVSVHGTPLGLDAVSAEMVHRPFDATTVPLALVRFPSRFDIGVLLPLAAAARGFAIGGEAISPSGLPVFLTPTGTGGVAMRRPPVNRFLCAVPATPEHAGSVGFQREEIREWETFTLASLSAAEVPATFITRLAPLASLVARGLSGPSLLAAVQAGPAIEPWLDTAGRLLPPDQAEWFGANMLASAPVLARLQLAITGDTFIAGGLPDLLAWLANRDAPRPMLRHVARDLDDLDGRLTDDSRATFGATVMLAARRSVQPRRTACILATARNEGIYLLDWIAYHRAIGAEALFIYSNDNDDGSEELLHLLAGAGEITWFDNQVGPGGAPQMKAYAHALSLVPDILDFRWTLCIDIDEFFCFDTSRIASLPHFLQSADHQPTDAIALSWLMFGSDGDIAWRDAPLWERFHHHEPGVNEHIKTAFRSNAFTSSVCHYPRPHFARPFVFRNAEGGMHHRAGDALNPSFSANPRADLAWIAHYCYKSASEYAWKKARGYGDRPALSDPNRPLLDLLDATTFNNQHLRLAMERDDRILACAAGAAAQRARLLAIPGVADCEARLKQVFTQRVAQIVDRLRTDPMPDAERELFAKLF